MNNRRTLCWLAIGVTMGLACSSKDALLAVDGGGDVATGTGGAGSGGSIGTGGVTSKGGAGGSATGRTGGSSGTTATGGTQAGGSGGSATSAGGSGPGGTGGVAGTGGLATGGAGGTTNRDAAADVNRDAAVEASDAVLECAPGYPVGSSKPLGDGCNSCVCQASGLFVCTTAACPADASADACPSGQRWCPGCEAGTGMCSVVCPASPCYIGDAAADTAGDARTDLSAMDAPVGCTQLSTQGECQARSDCHAVFTDPGTCGCAGAGCCARFSRCADGGTAVCKAPSTFGCTIATPFCESPYVLSYTASCYEGCVLNTECGP